MLLTFLVTYISFSRRYPRLVKVKKFKLPILLLALAFVFFNLLCILKNSYQYLSMPKRTLNLTFKYSSGNNSTKPKTSVAVNFIFTPAFIITIIVADLQACQRLQKMNSI